MTLFLSSCKSEQYETMSRDTNLHEAAVSAEHIGMYSYTTHHVELEPIRIFERLLAQPHDGRIYYCYINTTWRELSSETEDQDSNIRREITVVSTAADGSDIKQTKITTDVDIRLLGFRISESSHIEILAMERDLRMLGADASIIFIQYDLDGKEIHRHDYTKLLPDIYNSTNVLQAVITESGYIAVLLHSDRNNTLHLINTENNTASELQLNSHHRNFNSMVLLEDDRLLILDTPDTSAAGTSITVLREVDFHNEGFNDEYRIIGDISLSLYPAQGETLYDFLVSDANHLYGYSLKTNEQKALLNWVEAGIIHAFVAYNYVTTLNDESFYLLQHSWNNTGEPETSLYILSQMSREEMPELIVLTLGGYRIDDDTRKMIVKFNRENRLYRIEVTDYRDELGSGQENYESALNRLNTELAVGRGPDIIYGMDETIFIHGPLFDLYRFLDADEELDRSDFIPSLLKGLEKTDGTLPAVSTGVNIATMIGTKETVGHIDLWTPSATLSLAKEAQHMEYPFGMDITSTDFIIRQIRYGYDYIDYLNFKAGFENEEFIRLLESSKIFPSNQSSIRLVHEYDQYLKVLNGEQLLLNVYLRELKQYHLIAETFGDDIVVLGHPAHEGGKSTFTPGYKMGINAATQHAEGAWEFLRTLLLPAAIRSEFFDFPLRIDDFETMLTKASTPRYAYNSDRSILTDDDGNPVELPHSNQRVFTGSSRSLENIEDVRGIIGHILELYAMSETAADMIRDVVYNAVFYRHSSNQALWDMIRADLTMYYNGTRPAEETARIMQSRVQTYLSEQELLSGR